MFTDSGSQAICDGLNWVGGGGVVRAALFREDWTVVSDYMGV